MAIESSCTARGVQLPTLDEPFTPQSELPRRDPEVLAATSIIVAAAAQLTALVTPAPLYLITNVMQFLVSSALRVAEATHISEILREAGPQGLHINEIAAINHTDPSKLGRVLRLLATEHIFKEVSPDVFTNNRISSVIDTGKSVTDILANPREKLVGTSGAAAFVAHDEAFKSSAYLADAFCHPDYALSHAPNRTAFNLAYKTDLPFFEWIEQPGNEDRRLRMGIMMASTGRLAPPGTILTGLDWQDLPSDSVVVDVGGGVGAQSLDIAKAFPRLKVVVQDRPAVIPDAEKFWNAELPGALAAGQVTLQGHDFFGYQPVKNAAVFLLRAILHDWSDSDCIIILKKLRAAADSHTQLLLVEIMGAYACPDTTIAQDIPGGTASAPPAPLLANLGHANVQTYLGDLQLMVGLNGETRTLAQVAGLLSASGWALKSVRGLGQDALTRAHILAVPI
ncbi:hypothetical protein PLICRDRAFT_172543 [Plicaturopsis crispa FD-325 SS-3]|nr:hypothetical protein PLICRDRAFT_172543 [Plicaturopsis crispa FD-325 SS-3]